jgi:hypothetical protein
MIALAAALAAGGPGAQTAPEDRPLPARIAPFFTPPPALAGDFGAYRSPLTFDDGRPVKTPEDWRKRRQEIRRYWEGRMGRWPALVTRPKLERLEQTRREGLTQHRIRLEVAPGRTTEGYLLVPDGKGPFPAVVVVFYDPETGVGLKGERRDFALQLAKRGFVALSIGRDYTTNYPAEAGPPLQPLSFLGYVGANCYNALAALPEVDAKRIGVLGHSYGGKWAMFAACLYDRFACSAWSDPGIVFDEQRPNVNYWEPWYLGFDPAITRKRGVVTPDNPRTGAYKQLVADGRDLHELHALHAPRPFLVSGGSEDPPERWRALNHAAAVNRLLGYENRVAMTNRPGHDPTPESNEQLCSFFEHFLGGN